MAKTNHDITPDELTKFQELERAVNLLKEYCKKFDANCVGCPFNERRDAKSCMLAKVPCKWPVITGVTYYPVFMFEEDK